MKILLVNSVFGTASTGRTCSEVQVEMINNGHKCTVAYARGKKNQNANLFFFGNKIESTYHSVLSHILGNEGYHSFFSTKKLIRFIEEFKPDVVHLFVLHSHIISNQMLFKYLCEKKIPVVFNLDDCWWFTGKCMHFMQYSCRKWETCCTNCPALKESPRSYFFDRSKKMLKDKENWVQSLASVTFVGVSEWISTCAKGSSVAKNHNVETIYNWINFEIFKPTPITNKSKLKVLGDYVVLVSSIWRKNGFKMNELLKLSNINNSNIKLVVVGKVDEEIERDNILFVGEVINLVELAELYSSAIAYVHLSKQDTFGKVVVEAQACGTPAIVYNSTALPELIQDGCGFVVETGNVESIMDKIKIIKNDGKMKYRNACLDNVKEKFDMKKNINQLEKVYKIMCE